MSGCIDASRLSQGSLEPLFHPHSIALVGITVTNLKHWTRTFLEALLKFEFEHPLYLVNPKGGETRGLKVYQTLKDIPGIVDYVISTVPAKAAPGLIEECATKGVKAVQFCTAGFRETGEEEGARLEAEVVELSRRAGIRIIGPNCMGIYCPQSRLSFSPDFSRESGTVGFISQSGGNTIALIKEAGLRGVRFSKAISYGNACDLNESDFLEYLTTDPDTKIIALYVEGVSDGRRFRQVLAKAAKEKVVILLKGGVTQGGARATESHTGSLAGNELIWESLCKQLGVIWVRSVEELADILVTLSFLPLPKGRNAALIGAGGGFSVLITDQFERRGLKVPSLPTKIQNQIRQFSQIAGNILRNPIDYSQSMEEAEKLPEAVRVISQWEGIDFLTLFLIPTMMARMRITDSIPRMADNMLEASKSSVKPVAIVFSPGILPEEIKETFPNMQKFVSRRLPVYYSFDSAANAINLVLSRNKA